MKFAKNDWKKCNGFMERKKRGNFIDKYKQIFSFILIKSLSFFCSISMNLKKNFFLQYNWKNLLEIVSKIFKLAYSQEWFNFESFMDGFLGENILPSIIEYRWIDVKILNYCSKIWILSIKCIF